MLNNDEIQMCIYQDSTSVESFILDTFPISKSALKKFKLKKNYLGKKLLHKDLISLNVNIVNFSKISFISTFSDPRIIEENDEIVAISKSYKSHSYPLTYNEIDNTLSNLFSYRPELSKVNSKSMDRGLLHRLDYETSGVLLYAKNNLSYEKYRFNFNKLVHHKEYLAIVQGRVDEDLFLSDHLDIGSKKVKVSIIENENPASIKVIKVDYNEEENLSLIKVLLNQGHRHQIRAQLSHRGFPILGDILYGGQNEQRLYLHCLKYKVEDSEFEDRNYELFNLFFDFDS